MSSGRVVYGVKVVCFTLAIVFDIMIVNILFRNWRALRSGNTKPPAISFSILLRVMLFSVFRIGITIRDGAVLATPPHPATLANPVFVQPWVDMLQATAVMQCSHLCSSGKDGDPRSLPVCTKS
ncbi:hypothetical protein K439DRAFT_156410 [Ramaria rubella]|nr:hypothetical protein K439DRAFT_156410 [Ramaria rubella]